MNNLYLIISREYLERVKRKSFILSTILMPLVMLALMLAPTLVMVLSGPESKTIGVIDRSEVMAGGLTDIDDLHFSILPSHLTIDSAKNIESLDGILVIEEDVVDYPSHVQLYTKGAPSMQTEQVIRGQLGDALEKQRLARYDIPDLARIIENVKVDVSMSTFRIDTEETEVTSSMVSYLIGMVMAMMLYMFIMIYGQMVMTSIIEEKNNRVLEIVVSSVRPNALMLGKILGIGLVAITQILIWALLICSFSKWVMPLVINSMSSPDFDLLGAIGQLGDPTYVLMLFIWIMLFLIGGYMFYSSIYAAIGSAVDNIQDASQLTSIAIVPIILGFVFSMTVANDPNSGLAFWLSIIPFTSPMTMMSRLPFGIPFWETALSLVVLYASFMFLIWLCAKIYRVGIFMYGKKPTLIEIIRWARYK